MQCSHVTIIIIVAQLGVVSERHDLFVHLMNDGPYKITIAQGFMVLIILTCQANKFTTYTSTPVSNFWWSPWHYIYQHNYSHYQDITMYIITMLGLKFPCYYSLIITLPSILYFTTKLLIILYQNFSTLQYFEISNLMWFTGLFLCHGVPWVSS